MQKLIFVNLPVTDLSRAVRFYEAIGCTRNEEFSNDQSAQMVWSDTIFFQLLTRDYFATFTSRPLANPADAVGVLIALSHASRDDVDATTNAAASAGGQADVREPQDYGFMYSRAFADPDGHTFEPMWMDMSAMQASEQ
ncbi:VOC family protein [Mesorhizobium sp. CAU 1741]|uniref:VOC family protein n=1 Tax=Mesorhizobium sp. CAU 1741 TaxID=3140366 RepID=UPI00325BA802